jgi:hypothetical protein
VSKNIKQNLKAPCNACPFRKNSAGGYLGGVWTAPDLHKFVMAEQVFACHKTIDEDNQPMPELELCAGSVMYMNNNAKRCRDPFLSKAQDKFRGQDTSNILSVPEFFEHHKIATTSTIKTD